MALGATGGQSCPTCGDREGSRRSASGFADRWCAYQLPSCGEDGGDVRGSDDRWEWRAIDQPDRLCIKRDLGCNLDASRRPIVKLNHVTFSGCPPIRSAAALDLITLNTTHTPLPPCQRPHCYLAASLAISEFALTLLSRHTAPAADLTLVAPFKPPHLHPPNHLARSPHSSQTKLPHVRSTNAQRSGDR